MLRSGTAGRYSQAEGAELLGRAIESRADLVHTLDYRVPVTAAVEIPTIVTVHDVLRILDPTLCYSDTDFASRFGAEGLAGLRDAVGDLREVAAFPARRAHSGSFRAVVTAGSGSGHRTPPWLGSVLALARPRER